MPENFSIRPRKPTSKGTDAKALDYFQEMLQVSQPKGLETCFAADSWCQ